MKIFILSTFIFLFTCNFAFGQDQMEDRIILKVLSEFRSDCHSARISHPEILKQLNSAGILKLEKIFPNHREPAGRIAGEIDLSLIYQAELKSGTSVSSAVKYLSKSTYFEYTEPWYIPQLFYSPDDPMQGSQFALSLMKCYEAWDITQGDTSVIIGITDTGIDPDHPDLAANIHKNYADPINGIDDDGDGYIDNFMGWDMGEGDNDPSSNANHHGVHVSGIAAAVTDNATGIASPGFRSRIMPVKIANAGGLLTHAYQGVVYAADHGCRIINCSWGGITESLFGRNIVDYATINKNALVVAAAGNNNNDILFYPAAFDNSFAVAGTDSMDYKAITSNYGYYVDVSAPGWAIWSTWDGGNYSPSSGTSMAAPYVCGAAALVAARFPHYTAGQIAEQLRVTADNINVKNPGFIHKLGSGRINCFAAVTDTISASIKVVGQNFSDHKNNTFLPDDTLFAWFSFVNFLAPSGNITATVQAVSPELTVIDGSTNISSLGTMDTARNDADPFTFRISGNTGINQKVWFRLLISDGNTTNVEYFSLLLNTDIYHVNVNDIITTLTGKNRIGYYGEEQTLGQGFNYKGTPLLYESSLMVGIPDRVSDAVRDSMEIDDDFSTYVPIHRGFTSASDLDLFSWSHDMSSNNTMTLGIDIAQRAYAWTDPGSRNFIIVRYWIKNTGAVFSTIDSMYVGLFADWDISTYGYNRVETLAPERTGLARPFSGSGPIAAISLLSPDSGFVHHAINVSSPLPGMVNISDGFSYIEKYQALSEMVTDAGTLAPGSDVAHVVAAGPFTLVTGDSIEVCFALLAADSLSHLQSSVQEALLKYQTEIPLGMELRDNQLQLKVYPNPSQGAFTISGLSKGIANLKLYDVAGRCVYETEMPVENGKIKPDLGSIIPGMYIFSIRHGKDGFASGKIVIQP